MHLWLPYGNVIRGLMGMKYLKVPSSFWLPRLPCVSPAICHTSPCILIDGWHGNPWGPPWEGRVPLIKFKLVHLKVFVKSFYVYFAS